MSNAFADCDLVAEVVQSKDDPLSQAIIYDLITNAMDDKQTNSIIK